MKAIAIVLGVLGAVAVALTIGWAFAALFVWLGLNVIAGFGLSFAQVVGIALVVAYVAADSNVSSS